MAKAWIAAGVRALVVLVGASLALFVLDAALYLPLGGLEMLPQKARTGFYVLVGRPNWAALVVAVAVLAGAAKLVEELRAERDLREVTGRSDAGPEARP